MKVFCLKCKGETNHIARAEVTQEYDQENTPEMSIDFAKGTWQIVECAGCGEITFREIWLTSEDYNPMTEEMEETIRLYPNRNKDGLPIRMHYNVPRKIRRIYREVIECYNAECYTLCAAGLRGVIEGICAEEKVKDGLVLTNGGKTVRRDNLQGKIEGLAEKGLLTKRHVDILHEHRFLGNEAVHELDVPSKDELKIAIQIIEHTLENVYELMDKAEEFKIRKAQRKKKP